MASKVLALKHIHFQGPTYLYNDKIFKLYPPKENLSGPIPMGSTDSLSILYVIGESKIGFQKHRRKSTFFIS